MLDRTPHETFIDPEAASAFLAQWYGSSPRQLVSIVPDGGISAKCIWPQTPEVERDWLKQQMARRANCYFHVNQPCWAQDKKAEKSDIREVRALHVDIDPRADETPDECKARAKKVLASFDPPPSVVIDSGNGLQAFWLLDETLKIDGTAEQSAKVEAYNVALEVALGADSCHNLDRIMRVPGTVNVPNKKKIAKGRVAVAAVVVETMTNWVKHPISSFTAAPKLQHAGSTSAARGKVTIPGNLPRFASTDDLPVKLDDYTVMLIVNGTDVENPHKYPSRSEVLWRVLCDMVRSGCDDETIAAVILDPDFAISASVLDKPRSETYAADQIASAREEAINPALRELNARHCIIESDRGGRCVVAEEDWDEVMDRWHIKYQSFEAFRNRYMHRPVKVGEDKHGIAISVPMGKWWLAQEHRRQYRKIVFRPNGQVPIEQFNLWRGFGCEARPGNAHQPFLNHVRDNLCGGDDALFSYAMNWAARMIQVPGAPGEVALVVRGKKGTGKGLFFRTLGSLFGQHFLHISNPKFIVGDFNAHLRDCILLFADEAFFAGDKKHEGILKALITEPTLTVEAKGIDAEPAPNFLHIGIASNENWVVPASGDERRYFVLQANAELAQNHSYFQRIEQALSDGGRENLLHYLMNRNISDFEVRKVPWTAALGDQMISSLGPCAEYLALLLDEGVLPNNVRGRADTALTNGKAGIYGLLDDVRTRMPSLYRIGATELYKGIKLVGGARHMGPPRAWRFPPLDEARHKFEKAFCNYPWDRSIKEWQPADGSGRTGYGQSPF